MGFEDFIALAVVGGLLSAIVEIVRTKYGVDGNTTKLIVIGMSLVTGGLWVALSGTPYVQTAYMLLASASTVYALIIKK